MPRTRTLHSSSCLGQRISEILPGVLFRAGDICHPPFPNCHAAASPNLREQLDGHDTGDACCGGGVMVLGSRRQNRGGIGEAAEASNPTLCPLTAKAVYAMRWACRTAAGQTRPFAPRQRGKFPCRHFVQDKSLQSQSPRRMLRPFRHHAFRQAERLPSCFVHRRPLGASRCREPPGRRGESAPQSASC